MKQNGNSHPTTQPGVKTIRLSPASTPGYTHAPNLTEESAKRASELLTLNHDLYHTRFNGGLHNHIVHHLLALWALGASPGEIQAMWDYNISYQAPLEPVVAELIDLKDPARFKECLGRDECYYDFLRFFEDEVAEKGVPAVVNEYVFKGDELADDIFCRMFTDLVHPIIHLGCALEFNQPSLVAEALAAACVHGPWPKEVLLPTEEYIRSQPSSALPPPASLLDIFNDLARDPTIKSGVNNTDPFNKIPDGLLKRVSGAQFAPYLARFRLSLSPSTSPSPSTAPRQAPIPQAETQNHNNQSELRRRTAEVLQTCAYVTGAAQHPGKREAVDFVLLHTVTLSVFLPAFAALDWLADAHKARLLEAAARVAAVMYAGCGCPELHPDRVVGYVPRKSGQDGLRGQEAREGGELEKGDKEDKKKEKEGQEEEETAEEKEWLGLFRRAVAYEDEGHVAKLVRALYAVQKMGETPAGFPIARKDFVKIAHLAVDSVERAFEPDGHHRMPEAVARAMTERVGQGGEMVTKNQMRWVFYGGLDGAWNWVPDLE